MRSILFLVLLSAATTTRENAVKQPSAGAAHSQQKAQIERADQLPQHVYQRRWL
jgi:hypothetical protein